MQTNIQSILAAADKKLPYIGVGAGRLEQVEQFKKFLKLQTERLRMRHRCGSGGVEVARARCSLVDMVIRRACQAAVQDAGSHIEPPPFSAIALGGYGRGELAPFSDVDILFLHPARKAADAKRYVEKVLYLLWDIGLTIGHSYRSIDECVSMARGDLHSRTALADARLLEGDRSLFGRLVAQLDSAVYLNKREAASFVETMQLEIEARYDKFGRSVCIQEPNIKEGAGGLRDLHSITWIGHTLCGATSLDGLYARGVLGQAEYDGALRTHEFLTRVRNEAHFLAGRKSDLLTLDMQHAVADGLSYKGLRGLVPSEVFMRQYYTRANELHEICQAFIRRAARQTTGKSSTPRRVAAPGLIRRYFKVTPNSRAVEAEGFEIKDGELGFAGDYVLDHTDPMIALRIFSAAQHYGVGLGEDARQVVLSVLPAVDRAFRSSREAGAAFLQILERRGRVAPALRMMQQTGFLGRFIPEFARIAFLVQHDSYHRYTIDEHGLKAVEALDLLAGVPDEKLSGLAHVFGQSRHVSSLYLAAFLHDIGKGQGGDHSARGVRIAQRVTRRLGLDKNKATTVGFLIANHLLMSHTSQRRDLTEDTLIVEFVASIESLDNLNRLLLLTYADISAVGPGTWNDWKGSLLWDLYHRAVSRFTGEDEYQTDTDRIGQRVVEALGSGWNAVEVERHLSMMPERYLRAVSPENMAGHLKLIKRLATGPLVAEWRTLDAKHCSELTVSTADSAGLFARLAGTLSANGINILSADLYTREDGVVIDAFRICEVSSLHPIRERHWSRIEQKLAAAVQGDFDVAEAFEKWGSKQPHGRALKQQRKSPARVRFDQGASTCNTVVEVSVHDEPGLAYRIASCLASLGLDINFATIGTEKERVLDIFYVSDSSGLKLSDAMLPEVEKAILETLTHPPRVNREKA
jgi:[protein-PII] uridylyltransferase